MRQVRGCTVQWGLRWDRLCTDVVDTRPPCPPPHPSPHLPPFPVLLIFRCSSNPHRSQDTDEKKDCVCVQKIMMIPELPIHGLESSPSGLNLKVVTPMIEKQYQRQTPVSRKSKWVSPRQQSHDRKAISTPVRRKSKKAKEYLSHKQMGISAKKANGYLRKQAKGISAKKHEKQKLLIPKIDVDPQNNRSKDNKPGLLPQRP
jgi:hypothetical protein